MNKWYKTIYIEDEWELIVINRGRYSSVDIIHLPCRWHAHYYCANCNTKTEEKLRRKRETMEQIINFPV